ncbi:MAG: DNA-binding protein [Deltaproteobacteria bacterium]|nr:DNA-binding protein [Deltaproteobacteria bacterium]
MMHRSTEKQKGKRRSKTIARKQMVRERKHMEIDAEMLKLAEQMRPRTRRECMNQQRPCLFVSCKHHLYLDVNPETGSIKLNFPDKEVWELRETCALDLAERGGMTLEEVGEILNLTRERIRQVEAAGLQKLLAADNGEELKGLLA